MVMAEAAFKDIPEIFEVELGESLTARTESLSSFRELGPPDLCHVVKSTGRAAQRDLGSYHYISGVDASSSASLAAYINSLTYAIEDSSAWFSKTPSWKVKNGCYCCFNAFSRVDIRVDVKIPGGVNAYVIDLRGERHEATAEIWQETYVSALLRAILYSDDPTYFLDAYRKLDPIPTPEGEIRFLQAAEALFPKGWQVGSDPEIQVATVVSNHLTAGITKYFGDSGRYQQAANLFEKLAAREPEVSSLLAKSYLGMNEEVKAVQIMAAAMRQTPQAYTLLHVQCDFLRSKGKQEWALRLARQAVNCAPSEFVTWEKLAELYIDLGQYDSALLTLNSCPMFTFNGRDAHRALAASKVHLPFHRPIGDILPERHKTEDDECEPALQRLPAPGLRGTWARAYALLTRLVSQIGWDELLRTRSQVFVMEEEYRMQKTQGDIQAMSAGSMSGFPPETGRESDLGSAVIHEDGTVQRASMDDKASTRGIMSPETPKVGASESRDGEGGMVEAVAGIPTIRISTESLRVSKKENGKQAHGSEDEMDSDDEELEEDEEEEEENRAEEGKGKKGKGKATEMDSDEEDDEEEEVGLPAAKQNGDANPTQKPKPKQNGDVLTLNLDLEKPVQAAGEGEQNINEASPTPAQQEAFSFSNKRLCERWLDNLFMVLYEDLRVWTIFRAEVAHFKTQHVAYRKTGLEWEILGDLGLRLHHKEEAKEAYQRCLDSPRYSVKPWARLMEVYAGEGDIQRCVQTGIRVAAYQWADYTEMAYPTLIARSFFKLGQIHGHAKISFTLLSMGLPDPILKIMDSYLQYGKTFKVEGYDF
ncbi:chaps family protein [Crassisporium funariophilum]|nr:chaps family protein [Crassisporium funariophilum]